MTSNQHLRVCLVVNDENAPDLEAEHGLAIWIETPGVRILFDTGKGHAVFVNAERLNLQLAQTDFIVLSHGHYDHAGGLAHAIRIAPQAKLYLHPDAVLPRYVVSQDGSAREIGMPKAAKAVLAALDERRIIWLTGQTYLAEKIGVCTEIPRKTAFEDTGGSFYLDPEGARPDPIADDLALWIETPQGLVILVGCSHAGIINIINHIRHITGIEKIRAIIGGLHLITASDERLSKTVAALRQVSPGAILPCHCTGQKAVEVLKQSLGERVVRCYAGLTYTA